jgi:hypothetical protein
MEPGSLAPFNSFAYMPQGHVQTFAPSVPEELFLKCKRRGVGEIVRQAGALHERINGILPSYHAIQNMDAEKLRTTVLRLSQRVSELMEQAAPFGFPQESPEIVLRTPYRLGRLMASLHFMRTEPIHGEVVEYATRTHTINAMTLQVAEQLKLPKTQPLRDLSRAIFDLSLQFTSPAERSDKVPLLRLCTAAIEERGCLYAAFRKTIREQIRYLRLFVDSPHFTPDLSIVELHPAFEWETGWLQVVVHRQAQIQPYLAIVQRIEEFLQPYLNGTITEQTEDLSRAEVLSWLPAMIHKEFPHAAIPESTMRAVALTAYLRFGARNAHLGSLKGAYEQRTEGEDIYFKTYRCADGTEYHEQLKIRTALEIERCAARIQNSFTKALLHAFPVDFPSLRLTENEIKALAHVFLCHPDDPLPDGWDGDEDRKMSLLFSQSTASLGHRFPWD